MLQIRMIKKEKRPCSSNALTLPYLAKQTNKQTNKQTKIKAKLKKQEEEESHCWHVALRLVLVRLACFYYCLTRHFDYYLLLFNNKTNKIQREGERERYASFWLNETRTEPPIELLLSYFSVTDILLKLCSLSLSLLLSIFSATNSNTRQDKTTQVNENFPTNNGFVQVKASQSLQ